MGSGPPWEGRIRRSVIAVYTLLDRGTLFFSDTLSERSLKISIKQFLGHDREDLRAKVRALV